MCSFRFLQKFLKRGFFLSACLGLQGCNLWQKSPDATANENSTLVGNSEAENVSPEEPAPVSRVRAAPRRPVTVEEPVFEPLPTEEPTFSPVFDESTTYVVRKGDTLTKIARRFRVSVLQLMQENRLKNKNKLYVGQILAVPQKNASFGMSSSEAVEPYRVAKGDTLTKIAKRFGISIAHLQQMNGFDRDATLTVGQMLLVPNTSGTGTEDRDGVYCVQKGDTLGKIAKKFGTTVAKLREQNHLKKDTIYVGQKLYLSGSAPVKEKSSDGSSRSDAAPIEGDTYTVQAGDNLWLIAKRCRRSVAELTQLNDLQNPGQLQVGQVLRLKGRSGSTGKSSKIKKTFELSTVKHDEAPVEVRKEADFSSAPEVHDAPKPSSTSEEDDFRDLFEENKDMPVVPLDVTQ